MKKTWKTRRAAIILTAAMSVSMGGQVFGATTGDVNGDGSVSIADVISLQKYLTGQESTLPNAEGADLNTDGALNVVDFTLLKRMLLREETPENPPSAGDHVVTAITYGSDSVTLLNANGETVAAADAENVTVTNNTYVTITQPGEYDVDGECAGGQLNIDCKKETYADGAVTCNLRGLTLSNDTDSPIYVTAVGDEFVLAVKKETVNTISDGTSYTNADADSGAIYACDDMKIKGKGKLVVNGNCGDGIVCKNDLKIWNGEITVNAVDDGIRGKDSVRIGDPDSTDDSALLVTVKTESGDGIRSTGSDEGEGLIRLTNGTVNVNSYGDAIAAEQTLEVNGGNITLYTYQGSSFTGTVTGGWGGSSSSSGTEQSAKGLKSSGITDESGNYVSGGDIVINGGNITIDTSDDGIHCAGLMNVYGGRMKISTADDALHSDQDLTLGTQGGGLDDFIIVIPKGYEGVEALNITQYSGTVISNTTDDGYNAAGGADNSGNFNPGGWNPGQMGGGGDYSLTLAGGLGIVNVSDGDHDGFDSNGTLSITGGYFVSNGNEPFDCDGTKSYSGGVYVIDKGSSGGMGGMGGMGGSAMTSTVTASCSASANTRITLADSDGTVILSFIADKNVTSLTAGCSAFPNAAFYTGGTITGTPIETMDDTQVIYISGTISGGTKASGSSSGGNTSPWGW